VSETDASQEASIDWWDGEHHNVVYGTAKSISMLMDFIECSEDFYVQSYDDTGSRYPDYESVLNSLLENKDG